MEALGQSKVYDTLVSAFGCVFTALTQIAQHKRQDNRLVVVMKDSIEDQ